MEINLKDVTGDNFQEVIRLKLNKEQRDFVADNVYSIAQSKFYPYYQPRAIYKGSEVVGFLMYGSLCYEGRPEEYDIFRLMVDRKFQGLGIGRKAMDLTISEIKEKGSAKKITICYNPENPIAKDFYASFGFKEVGIDDDDEMIAEIKL